MADTIRCDVSDNVAQITLDDGKVNAMALAFFAGLNAALDRAEHERPGALVIAGRAGVFSAGLDLKVLPTLAPDALERTMVAFGRTMLRVFTFPIPTVAAVTGHAIAGGAGDENLHPGSEVPRDELRPAADLDGPAMDDERGLADHLIAARLGSAAISVSSCSAAHLTAMARWRALEIA